MAFVDHCLKAIANETWGSAPSNAKLEFLEAKKPERPFLLGELVKITKGQYEGVIGTIAQVGSMPGLFLVLGDRALGYMGQWFRGDCLEHAKADDMAKKVETELRVASGALLQWGSDDDRLPIGDTKSRCGRCGTTKRNESDTAMACGCHVGDRSDLVDGKWAQHKAYRMSDLAADQFNNPEVKDWMRERLSEKPSARFLLAYDSPNVVAFTAGLYQRTDERGDGWQNFHDDGFMWQDAMQTGRVYADAHGNPLMPDGAEPTTGWLRATQGVFGNGKIQDDIAQGVRRASGAPAYYSAPNRCARCGDGFALDESNEGSVVDPQLGKVHAQCGAALEQLRAEERAAKPMRVLPDPYKRQHEPWGIVKPRAEAEQRRLSQMRKENERIFGHVPAAFTADTLPASKAGEFIHPWRAEDADYE